MKKKISVNALIEIENRVEDARKTGTLSYTQLVKLMHDENVECDMLAQAIDLAQQMPGEEISAAIEEYDSSCPKMDELEFVRNLAEKYGVERGDVIIRIQYVRRINKEIERRIAGAVEEG